MLQHINRSNIFRTQRPQCLLRTLSLNKMKVIGFSIKNSNVSVAPNSDITFNYKEQLQLIPSTSQLPSVDISVSQLNTMTPNQKVNVTGTLSLGKNNPRKFW